MPRPPKIKRPMIFNYSKNHRLTPLAMRYGITVLLASDGVKFNSANKVDAFYWSWGEEKNMQRVVEMECYKDGTSRIYLDEERAPQLVELLKSWL